MSDVVVRGSSREQQGIFVACCCSSDLGFLETVGINDAGSGVMDA